ncbi:MAG: hypothetical protein AAGK02_16545, partial [Pseudomonadota bacterium]
DQIGWKAAYFGHLSHASRHTPQFRGLRGKITMPVNKYFGLFRKDSLGEPGLVIFGSKHSQGVCENRSDIHGKQ